MTTSIRITASILVFLAVVLGILAFVVGRRPVPPLATAPVAIAPARTFPVVVADRALLAGQPIPADAVRVVQMPVYPTAAHSRVADVVGQVPRVVINSGMPLTEGILHQGLPLSLRTGERGVAIPVDEVVGAGNAIQAGDRIDVFFTIRAPDGATQNPDRTVARLLLANLRVLAYGSDSLAPVAQAANRDTLRSQARSAVLAVPVADVDALILAAQVGKLTLALRFPLDPETPAPDLFAAPRPGLAMRDPSSADARLRADTPVNRAFAGVDSASLDGAPVVRVALAPVPVVGAGGHGVSRPAQTRDVEVIRGVDVKHQSQALEDVR
ncbi:Flp pilus assembly protein CpaB [Robbsia sp. Bb-Pol-6]|uniref:Flp pilus assembly protein CpaB n=1 Tax=Robbsia betulipollinis TaxID=2981849 RepID=A0ABT3ZNR2_9BURK|nr:Flp pilus assembly protein CpaB [Robbsia betulipollinis]MCY0388174.1 Flp pilus assembly protein CpaB [Robbsia betulipollinis]